MAWSSPEERERRLRRARVVGRVAIGGFALVLVALVALLVVGGPSLLLLLAGLLLVVASVRTVMRLRAIDRALEEGPDA